MDRYRSFAQLKRHERHGEDYSIVTRKGASDIAVMAPHGGGIEPGTDIIAQSIARPHHTFWAFNGIKTSGNRVLHIMSTRFDTPRSIGRLHGCSKGRHNTRLPGRKVTRLHGRTRPWTPIPNTPVPPGGRFRDRHQQESGPVRGENPRNLCNRCMSGRGVQLEITAGLRERMFAFRNGLRIQETTGTFFRFTKAVRAAILQSPTGYPDQYQ